MAAERLNLTMDESADKGVKLVEAKARDAANRNSRDIGRISVTGYDTGRSRESVERELKKIYASCGEITDVYIPKAPNLLGSYATIYFVGESAVDKALQLNGSDMGGWTLSAEEYPFCPEAARRASVEVAGYETSLSISEIQCEFSKLFSSCGKVTGSVILKSCSSSLVFLQGENIADTAPKLSGAKIGGREVLVRLVSHPEISTSHSRRGRVITGRSPENCTFGRPKKSTSHSREDCLITGRPNKKAKTTKLFKKKKKAKMTLE